MAPLRDLELTIQSRYPFVAVETSEEDRLEKALSDIAADLRVPFFVWTVTSGLRRAGLLNAMYDTQQPLRALNTVAAMTGEAMFLMKDLQRYFGEPPVVRKLLDLAPEFKHDRRVIVFSGVKIELPSELSALTALHALELPGADELKRIVKQAIESCQRDGPVRVELAPADLDRLVERLRGFTAFEAERAITRAILKNRSLGARDIETIVEIKKDLLKKDGVLEYVSPEENLAEVGGFANLKGWLAKRKKAFGPEAKQFGIDPPRGILLLGVQGCLRGDTRILLADGRMPTFETLARQVSDCLEPGEYDVAHRVALEDGSTALATKLQIHADRETLLVKFPGVRELELTPDHEVLTRRGWVRADELRVGDEVRLWTRSHDFMTPPRRTCFGRPLHSVRLRKRPVDVLPEIWTPELAELIGLFAAEGNQDRYRVCLTLSGDEIELAEWVRQRSDKLFGLLPAERTRHPWKNVREFRFNSFDVAVNLHPLIRGTHRTKGVPDEIFQLDDACVAGFLRALFEGDGCVARWQRRPGDRGAPCVSLKTVSASMAQAVQLLLQRLGIPARVQMQTAVHGYSRYPSYTVNVESFQSLQAFARTVAFVTEDKRNGLERGLLTFSRFTKPRTGEFAPVTAIECGRYLDRVYDLTVPGAARFVANGLVVHNCGKTLVARAVAKEWGLPLLKLEAARLYDKYVGETEKNLERALKMAEQMAPCVLMIDELEKGLSYNPGGDADAGLSKRIFGRLLTWLNDRKAAVFVVATSNNITELPPELTRKGRFDEIFFVDLPNAAERREIFSVHLKKRKRNPGLFDLNALAEASNGFTGAEIEQAVVAALYTAFSKGMEVTSAIIAAELSATKPLSVTRAEDVNALREWARDRAVMAS
jgi:SpoVK/Ycf46/Vps4 family AAA+-type ATPase